MKATGIVRRVDDLGRIVIPKEIRRTPTIPGYSSVVLQQFRRRICPCAKCTTNGIPNWIKQRKENLELTNILENTMIIQDETGFMTQKCYSHRGVLR